jgi:hypothetical protein
MAADALPTPEDLVAGYQENVSRFPRPRVSWVHRETYHAPAIREFERRAEVYDEIAGRPGLTDEERRRAVEEARVERSTVHAYRAQPSRAWYTDFWTDRRGCLFRLPPLQSRHWVDGPPTGWSFPDVECTPETLRTFFKDWSVYSFVPGALASMRVWQGVGKDGSMDGLWHAKKIDESMTGFQFPPLTFVPGAAALPDSIHPIDEFFARPVAEMRVERREMVDDRPTYVLVHRKIGPTSVPHTTPGDVKSIKIVSAWIDPGRGYLPLKITWDSALVLNGKTIGDEWRQPISTLTCMEILRVGNGYYPVRGASEVFMSDPDVTEPPDFDKVLAGTERYKPYVKARTLSWEVLKVEPDRPMSPEMFELEFPKGTLYYDATKQRSFLQGGTEEELQRLLAKAAETARQASSRRALLERIALWGTVVAALALGAMFFVRWWRR